MIHTIGQAVITVDDIDNKRVQQFSKFGHWHASLLSASSLGN
jgi:hypothetical protein